MSTLNEIQAEIYRQIQRDYPNATKENLRNMCALGLTEEAGEVAGLVKRIIRGNLKDYPRTTPEAFVEELGDVLWYLTACCEVMNTSLEDIWNYNKKKLEERYGK